MFQFLKRHIIKAISSLRRDGRRCHFGVVFQVGGESERAFFAFLPRHRKDTNNHSELDCPDGPAARRSTTSLPCSKKFGSAAPWPDSVFAHSNPLILLHG
jgi:hypothetical protein